MARYAGIVKKVGNTASINHSAAAQSAARYALSPSHGPATAPAKVTNQTRASEMGGMSTKTRAISSHNDINKFTSGINMHHPYKGPSSKGLGNDQDMQSKSTKAISSLRTPSGGTSKRGDTKSVSERTVKGRNDVMTENLTTAGNPTGLSAVAKKMRRGWNGQ